MERLTAIEIIAADPTPRVVTLIRCGSGVILQIPVRGHATWEAESPLHEIICFDKAELVVPHEPGLDTRFYWNGAIPPWRMGRDYGDENVTMH